jgi:hypothetical protein
MDIKRLMTWSDACACIAMAGILGGCAYAKPTCEAVNLANQACGYVIVEYVDDDGQVQRPRVPKSELRAAALRAARDGAP